MESQTQYNVYESWSDCWIAGSGLFHARNATVAVHLTWSFFLHKYAFVLIDFVEEDAVNKRMGC